MLVTSRILTCCHVRVELAWCFAVILKFSISAVVNVKTRGLEFPLAFRQNDQFSDLPLILSDVVVDKQVTVSCRVTDSSPGASRVAFSSSIISIGGVESSLRVTFMEPGRAVTAVCYGISEGDGLQYQANLSLGTPFSLVVLRAPSVSISQSHVDVVLNAESSQFFTVKLSEPVASDSVLVDCLATAPVESSAPLLSLSIVPAKIDVNQTSVQMPFSVVMSGSPILVSCRAQNDECVNNASKTTCQYMYSTSVGPAVIFAIRPPSITAYPTSSDGRWTSRHTSFLVLDAPLDAAAELQLNCGMQIASSVGVSDLPTCLSAPNITVDGIKFTLVQSKIVFKPTEFYKNVTVQASPESYDVISEQVLLIGCCSTGENSRYQNLSVDIYLSANFYGSLFLDWSRIADKDKGVQTSFMKMDSSCPCDLTPASCDINCCCDEGCSDTEKRVFDCLPGLFGGVQNYTPLGGCDSLPDDADDWLPYLCVYRNNSPFVGYMLSFTTPSLATSIAQFEALLRSRRRRGYSFEEGEARFGGEVLARGYQYGDALRSTSGQLTLPGQFATGACFENVLSYLVDSESACVHSATERTCGSPVFDANMYVHGDGLTHPSWPVYPKLLSSNLGSSPVRTKVEYYCLDSASNFMTYSGRDIDRFRALIAHSVSAFLDQANSTAPVRRCAFDDGRTLPPSPLFNSSARTCENAALEVSYGLAWSGVELKSVLAKVTIGTYPVATTIDTSAVYSFAETRPLASLPLASEDPGSMSILAAATTIVGTPMFETKWVTSTTYAKINVRASVAQRFAAVYSHVSSPSVVPVSSSRMVGVEQGSATRRSGNPGYIRGMPIVTMLQNETNATSLRGLLLWKPLSSGLCRDAEMRPVEFGNDALSGCSLWLRADSFRNCSSLQLLVKAQQERLVRAVKVGRTGNLISSGELGWIDVARAEPVFSASNRSNLLLACMNIPAHLKIEVLTSKVGKLVGVVQEEIVGVRTRYVSEVWSPNCAWDDVACRQNSGVSLFYITSSVQFVSIPVTEPPVKTKSELAAETNACLFDACMADLLFPLRSDFDVASSLGFIRQQLVRENLSEALMLILLALPALWIARVWFA